MTRTRVFEIEDNEVIRIKHGDLEVIVGCSVLSCTGPTILEVSLNRRQVSVMNIQPDIIVAELVEKIE